MNWYQPSVKDIYHKLETSETGLTDSEAIQRLEQYGPNKLVEEEEISRLKILLHQFTSPLIYILLIAGIVTLLLKEYIDSGVIFAVVILNALIGFLQEYKAEESVRALKKMVVPRARVLREGKEKEINSHELVPGDIVLLSSGAKVPADLRLIHTIGLKIEEAMLTGESVPAEKITGSIKEENLTPGDQRNMAFMGTVVVNGRAKGVVAETGAKTVLGGIAREVSEIGIVRAPLQDKIHGFAKAIELLVFGASIEKARTVAVTTMVFFQFFQAWNSRSELQSIFRINLLSNPFLFFSMITAFLAQLSVIYVPALQWVFRTEPITTGEWLRILMVSATVVLVVEIDKWMRRRKGRSYGLPT